MNKKVWMVFKQYRYKNLIAEVWLGTELVLIQVWPVITELGLFVGYQLVS